MEIITTIGPSSIQECILTALSDSGATDFRINLSHSTSESLEDYYSSINSLSLPTSIDTQGAQVRITKINGKSAFKVGSQCFICASNRLGDRDGIELNHAELFTQIEPSDILKVDFNGLKLKFDYVNNHDLTAKATVISSGSLNLNRAVDVSGKSLKLHPLTTFDEEALRKYLPKTIKSVYLSFASSGEDVQQCKNLINNYSMGDPPRLISKIESIKGIANLRSIAKVSDGILIDRGDLSREISISRIPFATMDILNTCKKLNTPCYVATNVLDSMIANPLPSRAEISDLFTLLTAGFDGVVLAAEVAIGKHPIESVQVVRHMQKVFQYEQDNLLGYLRPFDIQESLSESLRDWL